jgi:hypothetical protein
VGLRQWAVPESTRVPLARGRIFETELFLQDTQFPSCLQEMHCLKIACQNQSSKPLVSTSFVDVTVRYQARSWRSCSPENQTMHEAQEEDGREASDGVSVALL